MFGAELTLGGESSSAKMFDFAGLYQNTMYSVCTFPKCIFTSRHLSVALVPHIDSDCMCSFHDLVFPRNIRSIMGLYSIVTLIYTFAKYFLLSTLQCLPLIFSIVYPFQILFLHIFPFFSCAYLTFLLLGRIS